MKKKDFTRRRFITTVSAGSAAALVSSEIPSFGNIITENITTVKTAIYGDILVMPAKGWNESDPWWVRELPLTILDSGNEYTGVIPSSPDMDIPLKTSLAFNTEHAHVMGMAGGLDDQEFFFSSKAAGKKNEDYLARYLPEAKKSGLRVIIYFDVHWYKGAFGDQHPDWRQIQEGGGTISEMYDQPSTGFCVNGPWREWCFQVVRDLCAYPIDGIFYDGPVFFPKTCYCSYCQEKFQKIYGRALPSKKQRTGKSAKDFLEFQAGSLADMLRDTNTVIKSINPGIVFYMNGGGLGGNWSTARLNRILIQEQDLLGSEGGYLYGDLTRTPIWKPGVTARLLETQSPDKPRVIFSSGRPGPWNYSNHSEPELRLLYAGTVANAASVFFFTSPQALKRPQMQALAGMNRFVAKNAAYYRGTYSEATTALVWSDTTANFYSGADAQLLEERQVAARSEIGNLNAEFSGLADTLLRSQTPFDVIDDVTLEHGNLNRYSAIFLPNVACMNQKTADSLTEYVQQGGNLFATFETSIYDEMGIRRNDFALADMFGVSDARKVVGPNGRDYMQPSSTSPLLESWPRDLIPCPVYHLSVKPTGAEVLAYFMKPMAGTYAALTDPSDDPALVVNRYGKGKVVYSSGDIGNAINSFHYPEWCRLIENVLREMAPSPVMFENTPGSVEVVLRSQEDGRRLLLHLINFTGEMTRPIRRIVPLQNVIVTLRTSGKVKKIHTLMRPQTLDQQKTGSGEVKFVIPLIEEYEVVVLEM